MYRISLVAIVAGLMLLGMGTVVPTSSSVAYAEANSTSTTTTTKSKVKAKAKVKIPKRGKITAVKGKTMPAPSTPKGTGNGDIY